MLNLLQCVNVEFTSMCSASTSLILFRELARLAAIAFPNLGEELESVTSPSLNVVGVVFYPSGARSLMRFHSFLLLPILLSISCL